MTTTTQTKKAPQRSRAKSTATSAVPEAINQTVLLRVEPRLKWTGSIDVVPLAGGGGRAIHVLCHDAKLKVDLDWRGSQASESAALIEAFNRIEAWVEETRKQQRGADWLRLQTVFDQLRAHRKQLIVEGVTATQAEASAKKEQVVDDFTKAECNRDGTAWSLAEWTNRLNQVVDLDAWRRRAIPGIVEESLAAWYHDGLTITEAAREIDELIDGEMDLRDDEEEEEDDDPPPPAAVSAALQPEASGSVQTREVPLALLKPHPLNPRTIFRGIEELAASLKSQGQLVEGIARRLDDHYQILAGHRRYQAAAAAGLTTLRMRVVDVDDAQALEIVGRDNEDRENFDAVARGRWYRSLLDLTGESQRQLAARLGVSQAEIANHVRILDLPDDWQQRVISGELTGTHARVLTPWSERPAVLDEVARRLEDEPPGGVSVHHLGEIVQNVVRNLTLPVAKDAWFSVETARGWRSGTVLFTAKDLARYSAELDVVEVPSRDGGTQPRAFNRERWIELHGNLEAAQQKRRERASLKGKRDGSALSKADREAADQERRAKQDEILAKRLDEYRVRWYQGRILDLFDAEGADAQLEGGQLLRFALYFGGHYGSSHGIHHDRRDSLLDALTEVLPKKATKALRGTDGLWEVLAQADEPDLWRVLAGTLRRWLERDPFSNYCDLKSEDIPAMAKSLGIRFSKEWRVDRSFLDLHTKEQLLDLCTAWKIDADPLLGAKRDAVMEAILAADQAKRLPPPKKLRGAQ